MRVCALVLARGGSKAIKNKNIVKINNKPMLEYTLSEASKSKFIDKVFLMTDSNKYKKIANSLNIKKLEAIGRSKESSTDSAQSEVAITEFVEKYNYDLIFFIQLTNVFLKTKDINEAIKIFFKKKYDSLLSVIETHRFLWVENKDCIKPLNYDIKKRPLKADMKSYFMENGSFYIFLTKNYKKYKNRLHKRIGYYVMNKESYFDIDDKEDLKIVKKLKI